MKPSNRTARNKTPLYRRVLRSSWIQEAVKMTSGTPAEPCPCAWNLCCSIRLRDRPEADRRTAVPADLLSSEFQLFEIITIGEDSATPCRSSRSCELPRQPLERAAIFEHGCGVSPRQLLRPTADKAIASAQPTALTPFLGNCVTEHWVRVHFGSTWWWLMDRGTASPESPGFEVSFGDTSFQAQSALTIIEFPAQGALAAWRLMLILRDLDCNPISSLL